MATNGDFEMAVDIEGPQHDEVIRLQSALTNDDARD